MRTMPYSMILSSSLVGEDGVRRPWFRHFFFRASVIISIDLEIRSCLTILSSNSRTIHQLVMTQKDWIVNRPWRSVYHCRDMFIWCPKWPKAEPFFKATPKKLTKTSGSVTGLLYLGPIQLFLFSLNHYSVSKKNHLPLLGYIRLCGRS